MKSFVLVVALLAWMGANAATAAETAPSIDIVQAWARATPAGAKTGAAYLTLINKGSADDSLVGVSSDVAGTARLHVETMEGGVMKMRPVAAVALKAGGKAVLAPGGTHVMLIGLKQRLTPGETFPLTLHFEKAGAVDVQVTVAAVGASGPGAGSGAKGMGDMKDMDMKDMDMKGMDMGGANGGSGK